MFADDTSLFSKAIDRKHSEKELNKDLKLISQLAYQWKYYLILTLQNKQGGI